MTNLTEAGPELDRWIAINVMQWESTSECAGWSLHIWKGTGYCALPGYSNSFHPSTNIAHAFEVVHKLSHNPPGHTRQKFELKSPCDKPGHNWLCTFKAYLAWEDDDWSDALTPELAICLAAVKLIESENIAAKKAVES